MTETLALGHLCESAQPELSNEKQGLDDFQKSFRPCALDKSRLSIARVNW